MTRNISLSYQNMVTMRQTLKSGKNDNGELLFSSISNSEFSDISPSKAVLLNILGSEIYEIRNISIRNLSSLAMSIKESKIEIMEGLLFEANQE